MDVLGPCLAIRAYGTMADLRRYLQAVTRLLQAVLATAPEPISDEAELSLETLADAWAPYFAHPTSVPASTVDVMTTGRLCEQAGAAEKLAARVPTPAVVAARAEVWALARSAPAAPTSPAAAAAASADAARRGTLPPPAPATGFPFVGAVAGLFLTVALLFAIRGR